MKEIVHDFYEGTEVVSSLYNFLIDYWHGVKPGVDNRCLHTVQITDLALIRLRINAISTVIARTNEIINDLEPCYDREDYINEINEYIDSLDSFSKITSLVELSPNEKRQKIKNCLAHANFKVVEIEDNEFEILIENEFIKGKVTIEDLEKIKSFYIEISDKLDITNNFYSDAGEFFALNRNNNECLENAINKIKFCSSFEKSKGLQRNITVFSGENTDDFEYKEIDFASAELIKNFVKYIGINNWNKLNVKSKIFLFSKYIKFMLLNKIDFRQNTEFVIYPPSAMVFNNDAEIYMVLDGLKYVAPCAYVSCILDFGYYGFNYLREANKKENSKIVDFKNFNLAGIDCFSKYDEPSKYVDESIHLKRLLDENNRKEQKVLSSIEKAENNKAGLKTAKNLSEERKKELELQFNEIIKSRYIELKELQYDKVELSNKLLKAEKYYDCSNFFRHLRNSFAHGFYEVDYSKALNTKRLEEVCFTFRDYDIDSEDRNNKTVVFEVKINAKRLVRLLNEFMNLITNCMERKGEVGMVIISTSGKYEQLEKRTKDIEEEYDSQKIKVIRRKNNCDN